YMAYLLSTLAVDRDLHTPIGLQTLLEGCRHRAAWALDERLPGAAPLGGNQVTVDSPGNQMTANRFRAALRKCDVVVVGTNAIRVAHNNDARELHRLAGHDSGRDVQCSPAFG